MILDRTRRCCFCRCWIWTSSRSFSASRWFVDVHVPLIISSICWCSRWFSILVSAMRSSSWCSRIVIMTLATARIVNWWWGRVSISQRRELQKKRETITLGRVGRRQEWIVVSAYFHKACVSEDHLYILIFSLIVGWNLPSLSCSSWDRNAESEPLNWGVTCLSIVGSIGEKRKAIKWFNPIHPLTTFR